MSRKPSRRGFLAAVGASSCALAGCSGFGGIGLPGDSGGNATPTGTEPMDDQQTTPGAGSTEPPFTGGTVVEDFENLELWGSIGGTYTADPNVVYAGSQSVRLENPNGNVAGIYKAFPDGLDLSQDDLSIALKLEKPAAGRLAVEYLAPGRANHLVSKRYVTEPLDSWFRVDLGYTGERGEPDTGSVQELRIMVLTETEPIRFWIDDLRKTPKPDKAKYILSFDDTHVSQYDVAFQEMQSRGWPGVTAVIPAEVGSSSRLGIGQLRHMRSAGWDIASHPQTSRPLPDYPKEQQRALIERTKEYLVKKGFPDGARFFFAPYDAVNGDTLDVVSDLHEYGFLFGACPSAAPPTGKYTISQIIGHDAPGTRRLLNLAEEYKQLAVVRYSSIGQNADASLDVFLNVLNHIETKDADVITPSQLLEMAQQQRS